MKDINVFLKQEVDRAKTPSVHYAFFDTNSTIHQFSYGLRNIKTNAEINNSTTYNLFSVTKTFTALAVLQLAETGKLHLKDRVSEYLPGFAYSNEITIEQLLNHTSGIPNPLPLRWTHLSTEHNDFNRNSFFKDIFEKNNKLKFTPGSKFAYSNLGYVLLGQLIEQVSGKTYEAYIEKNIFENCGSGSNELSFTIEPAVHATGYQKRMTFINVLLGFMIDKKKFMGAAEGKWKPFNNFYVDGISYGGMIGSASGLIKYAQSLLKRDSLLLNDAYKELLFTEGLANGKPTGMSFSWFTGNLRGNTYYAHAGGGGGYYVELRVYPGLGLGSVILFNRSGMKDERILDITDASFVPGK